jgi:hypothetical protein
LYPTDSATGPQDSEIKIKKEIETQLIFKLSLTREKGGQTIATLEKTQESGHAYFTKTFLAKNPTQRLL